MIFIEFDIKKKNSSWKNGDIRTNQIVFQYDEKKYFNMMCE